MVEILAAASEIFPLVKTGGLADVAGALPASLAPHGFHVTTLVPGYTAVLAALERPRNVHRYDAFYGGKARILAGKAAGLAIFALDAPHLYDRPGGPYAGADGLDHADNAIRFAALARAAADIAQGMVAGYRPAVLHVHDWQTALAPAFLAYDGHPHPPTLCTIHNLAFQGKFPRDLLAQIGLPPHAFSPDGVEYYGDIGFLKAGLRFADRLTTVSPTYAAEIRTAEFGMGMDGLLRGRGDRLSGILNGIDGATWNPASDPALAAHFTAGTLDARAQNKAALQAQFGLDPDPAAPLFGVVSRLSWQKGLDLLLDALPAMLAQGGQLAVLGSGEAALEARFRDAAAAYPGRVACRFTYDEQLAHRIQGGIDALIVPSRFEPCGLTQLCALRYGAAPIVARVGGLSDTVIDANEAALSAGVATGLQFFPPEVSELSEAIRRAFAIHHEPGLLRRLRLNGMRADVSWRGPAKRYAALFRDLAAGPRG